ncbi:MAG: YybS family protein [Clostridia bacterium]|nr:YybS family protein [Clostridia bacterium]
MPASHDFMFRFREVSYSVLATLFICALGIFMPFMGSFLSFIWAVPVGVLTAKSGLRAGLLSVFITTAGLVFLVSPLWGVGTGIQLGSLGLVLGYMLKRGSPLGHTLIAAFGTAILTMTLIFFLPLLASDGQQGLREELSTTMDELLLRWQQAGVFEREGINRQAVEESLNKSMDWFMKILPSMTVITAMISAFLNFIISRGFLRRLGVDISELPPFRSWRVPWFTSWGIVFGLGLALLGDYLDMGRLFYAGQNVVLSLTPIILVMGLSVAVHMYSRLKSQFVKLILIFVSFFYLPLTIGVLALVGAFDPLVDFRKILSNKE